MKYEFRPFAKGNHILVSLTGKVYEKGEHPEYIKYKVIEVIDDYGNKIDAFEDELTNILVEPKQETLEKVAKKQWGNVHRTESIDFIAGANLQAERMLTDGDLVKLLDFVSKEYNISNGVGWFHSHESIEDVS
jgi:hypothetical protein